MSRFSRWFEESLAVTLRNTIGYSSNQFDRTSSCRFETNPDPLNRTRNTRQQINAEFYKKKGVEIVHNSSDEVLKAVEVLEENYKNLLELNSLNQTFWNNLRYEWNAELSKPDNQISKIYIDLAKKIKSIYN